MRTALALLLLVLAAAARDPRARARLAPDGPVAPGQPVELIVDLLVPTWFSRAPRWPVIEVAGAITILPETPAVNHTERIDGDTWAVQTRTYFVCPLRPGAFAIPSFGIATVYAVDGDPSEPVRVATPPMRFEAAIPEAARGAGFSVTTPSLRIGQTYDPTPEDLRVGDALTRTITIEATDTFALFLPPLRFADRPGLSVYAHEPVLEDRGGVRGEPRTARRVESVTMVFEREGRFEIPAVHVRWWNPGEGNLETSALEGAAIEVAPNPEWAAAREEDVAPPSGHPWPWALAIAFFAAAAWVLRGLPARAAGWWRTLRASEPAAFRRVARACRAGDPRAVLRSLQPWMRHTGVTTLRAYAPCDPGLLAAVDALDAHLFGRGGVWSGERLLRTLRTARRHRHRHGLKRFAALPPLNL